MGELNLGTASIGKLLIKYSVPAIIGMLVNGLYNIVDRMFIGNIPDVGPMAITGLGITMPIMTIVLAFGMLVGIGTTATMSIKLGEGKKEEAEKLLGNGFTLSIIISLVITVLGLIFANPILEMFGASPNTLVFAKEYINIILVGTVFNVIGFGINSTIRSDGNPRISATIVTCGCLINIVLDALFIFGFGWGIKGAALATVIAQAINAMQVIYYYTKSSKSNLKIKKENLKLQMPLIKTIFAIGLAPFFMQIAASLVQVVSNNTLKIYGGDLAIGAMAVIASIGMVFLMPIFGINQGSQPIIGFNYGANKLDRVRKVFKVSLIVATSVLTVGVIFIELFPQMAISLFNKDKDLLDIGVNGIRIYLMMLPLVGVSVIGSNYFQSVGKAKIATFLSLLRQVILLIPLTLILPKFMGLNGVWIASAISDLVSTIITIIFLAIEFKKQKKDIIKMKYEVDYASGH